MATAALLTGHTAAWVHGPAWWPSPAFLIHEHRAQHRPRPHQPHRHPVAALWTADAICETGHNPPDWQFRAGQYEGGIAFASSTWRWWSGYVTGARAYAHAYLAPAWLQAAVAEYGLDHYGRWGCLYHSDVWAHR